MEVKIDKELENLIDPLTAEEYDTLKYSIEKEGLRDPLIIWEKENILLDGHNRYKICQECGIEIKCKPLSFPDKEHAINWILTNQLGRRNLNPNQKNYLIGKQYNLQKNEHGGDRRSEVAKSNIHGEYLKPLIENLAQKNEVSKSTVQRASKYAEAVDTVSTLSENPIEQRREILSGKLKLSQKVLTEIAEMAKENEGHAREYFEDIKTGSSEKKPVGHSKKLTVELPVPIYETIRKLQKEKEQDGKKPSISEIVQELIQHIKKNDLEIPGGDVSKNENEESTPETNETSGSNKVVFVKETREETSKRVAKYVLEMDEKYPRDYSRCASELNQMGFFRPVPGGYKKWTMEKFQYAVNNARRKLKIKQNEEG